MTDQIVLKNMMFYGFHGVYEYEREQGQRFYLDIIMNLDLQKAGNTDDLEQTVDYASVYTHVKDIVENHRFKLLEALGAHIGDLLLELSPQLKEVIVKVRKPAVPLPGQLDYVEVTIRRSKA